MNDPVVKQYTRWCYPRPVNDLVAHAQRGIRDSNDPSLISRRLWPRGPPRQEFDILVAGCGTYQAAFLAFTNPRSRVLGIDLSSVSLRHHECLREKHKLTNLELTRMDLCDVASLGRSFDYVVATGVIHHMADPGRGLSVLRSVLRRDGVVSIMVYGRYARAGVYTLQELFRRVGLGQDASDLDVVKATLAVLPPWHHVRSYLPRAQDLAYDSGLVDTFLHVRDRAYSVPEVLELVRAAGLAFQGWRDPAAYALCEALPPEHPLLTKASRLAPEDQWTVVELLTQAISTHGFLACHKDRPLRDYQPDFASEEALEYRPERTHCTSIDTHNLLRRLGRSGQLGPEQASWVRRADGRTTIGELVASAQGDDRERAMRFFAEMWTRGYLLYALETNA
jgi:SAM-dependent methyltransferase